MKRSLVCTAVAVYVLDAAGWYLGGLVPGFGWLSNPLIPFLVLGAAGVVWGIAVGIHRKSWRLGLAIMLGSCIGTAAAFGTLFALFLSVGD